MANKEKNTTKKLIQKIDLDSPSVKFSDKVMAKVNIISDDETLTDIPLSSLLKKNCLETPNADFTTKIMAKVGVNDIADYKPIISKRGWNVIILFFASFIIYILSSKPATVQKNQYISEFSTIVSKLITNLGNSLTQNFQVPSILVVSIVCLSILLLLDSTLRTKRLF